MATLKNHNDHVAKVAALGNHWSSILTSGRQAIRNFLEWSEFVHITPMSWQTCAGHPVVTNFIPQWMLHHSSSHTQILMQFSSA